MRRFLVVAMSAMMVLGMLAGPALANNGQGRGAPDREARGNSLISQSEAAEVTEVLAQTYSPDGGEDFTFYRISYVPVEHDGYIYREPSRLGPDNVDVAWDTTSSRVWFGVSAGAPGQQSQIVHDGTVWQYFYDGDSYTHLQLEFDDGELLHVNGVSPE